MKQFKHVYRYSAQGISLIVLAFSLIGYLTIDESTNETTSNSAHPMLTSENISDNKVTDDQESVFVADGDTVVVKSFGTDLSYDITEIRAKAGSTITIRYENTSDMPHNIVFVKSRADIQPVGVAGIRARDTEYVPQDEANQSRILYSTKLAKPGSTVYVTVTVPEPGTYPYICTYPGHFTMMQGDLVSEA
jgi:azurin